MTSRTFVIPVAALVIGWTPCAAQTARVSEETRTITTYPFSEPNPIPILTRDPRLYPYHAFEGYAHEGVPREWKVVHLENDLIDVYVLPEAGGKVWGAVVKRTGHEFIYRNEVMKFRNIALRGPWTSGGIEFNFGVIGHTPSTATPVDYALRENPDGSVSCVVGTMDLPSRTVWRVEIRVPPDRASFDTNVLWYNPTPLEQPYYNWMTGAAFARNDLEMFMPGTAYLEHSGTARPWPFDAAARYLPAYANNTFDGSKSYHAVGELHDFFGGYYHDAGFGFGHWSRYEEMPGQKLWLWALSREGGVWENLLTDTHGQYIEFQAGRLFVQYSPGAAVNPITQVAFDPERMDRWSETWFPVEGIGGISAASRYGAMFVTREPGGARIAINAFGDTSDTLRVSSGDRVLAEIPLTLPALDPVERVVVLPDDRAYRVQLPNLALDYSSDTAARDLRRPFATDTSVVSEISEADRLAFEAGELAKGRRHHEARERFERALGESPWNRDALLGMADLEYRRARYAEGLIDATRALQLDTYDARANFVAGNLYRAVGRVADARDAFGWAARATAFRSAAYVQLAEIALANSPLSEAERYARLALDYDRYCLPALEILATAARNRGDQREAASLQNELLAVDPLHHFVFAEDYLTQRDSTSARALTDRLRSEYPDQTILELAIGYVRRGASEDARTLLQLGMEVSSNPLLRAWEAWLADDPALIAGGADPAFVFPYRQESLPVLRWAVERSDHWSWRYLLALELWGLDRVDEAAALMASLDDQPDFAPFYAARGLLMQSVGAGDPESDLRRAVQIDGGDRILRVQLVRYLQNQSRWQDALAASQAARRRFPNDFNLDLLHAAALVALGRASEAAAIVDRTDVLPSENAGASHRLYQQAHTMTALEAMERGRWGEARRELNAALEWPEHLGQGKPYDPEERLQRFLLGVVAQRTGDAEEARWQFESVVNGTDLTAVHPHPLDLLAVQSLSLLGRSTGGLEERFGPVRANLRDDLDARMLRRALAVGEER